MELKACILKDINKWAAMLGGDMGGEKPAKQAPDDALQKLGWQNAFSQHVDLDELESYMPVRVFGVHRNSIDVRGEGYQKTILLPSKEALPAEQRATVGDWLLIDKKLETPHRVLPRKSVFKRRAAGHTVEAQMIAANIDTLFIVTSCNQDFNIARLERYLALAYDADVEPVIVLTKIDLCDDADNYVKDAQQIVGHSIILTLDARQPDVIGTLEPWCKLGKTIAFVGSSGVGKSTLLNALSGDEAAITSNVREGDGKGRHTTTHRELHMVPSGALVLDTPGMRELQITDLATGVDTVFEDIVALTHNCKFSDCAHEVEPGCAVLKAIEEGVVDKDRVQRWRKLVAEDQHNTASLADRKRKDKKLGRLIKSVKKGSKKK